MDCSYAAHQSKHSYQGRIAAYFAVAGIVWQFGIRYSHVYFSFIIFIILLCLFPKLNFQDRQFLPILQGIEY